MKTTILDQKTISIVVPIFNEVNNIESLHKAIADTCRTNNYNHELIFVDDGSNDGSIDRIKTICNSDANTIYIRLKRNYGQTAALAAGFDIACGINIVALDADLQNDPADIPLLLAKLNEGYDLVNGWRKTRQDPFLSVTFPSIVANMIIKRITGVHIHDTGCSLKIFKRELLNDLHLYGEMHRFIPALLHWSGAKISEVPVSHHKRASGTSKYSINKLPRVILDLINIKFLISYSTRPIQIFGKFAFYAATLSLISLIMLVGMKYHSNIDMTGNPFLMLAVFLAFVSVQFVTMGLLGEINIRIYHETTRNKIYHVAESNLTTRSNET